MTVGPVIGTLGAAAAVTVTWRGGADSGLKSQHAAGPRLRVTAPIHGGALAPTGTCEHPLAWRGEARPGPARLAHGYPVRWRWGGCIAGPARLAHCDPVRWRWGGRIAGPARPAHGHAAVAAHGPGGPAAPAAFAKAQPGAKDSPQAPPRTIQDPGSAERPLLGTPGAPRPRCASDLRPGVSVADRLLDGSTGRGAAALLRCCCGAAAVLLCVGEAEPPKGLGCLIDFVGEASDLLLLC